MVYVWMIYEMVVPGIGTIFMVIFVMTSWDMCYQ
jgi:hypothetical protein